MGGPILYLTGEYPRATDTFIQREVAALRALGFDIRTASVRRTGPEHLTGPEQQAEAAGTFHVLEQVLRLIPLIGAKLAALRAPGRFFAALALAWRTSPKGLRGRAYQMVYLAEALVLARHMRSLGVVHLHNHIAKASGTVAMLASALTGIPYSFTLHGPDELLEPGYWRLDEKIARAAFVACISDFARSQAMLHCPRAAWGKLHVVHCGIDPARYDASPHGDGGQLLFVGRLAAVKGLPVLFEALTLIADRLPRLRLTLVGDGPDRRALEAEARGLPVAFVGYKSQSEVAELLRGADALVLPSFAEGLPVVLMEAMAARLPVIATRIAGVPELVEDGASGLLVPPGDAQALAAAIAAVLGDPARAGRMGAAGRAKVSAEFDIATEAAWLGVLFLASQTGGPRPGKRPGVPA
ncbi:MAG: glycosyltransferase family 4 protein [Rhodobacterales bacterium]|nr:glycosyltransferase family 4 protein [Rhodobacterales bacterium]